MILVGLIDGIVLDNINVLIGSFHIVILPGITLQFKGIIQFINDGLIFIYLLIEKLFIGL